MKPEDLLEELESFGAGVKEITPADWQLLEGYLNYLVNSVTSDEGSVSRPADFMALAELHRLFTELGFRYDVALPSQLAKFVRIFPASSRAEERAGILEKLKEAMLSEGSAKQSPKAIRADRVSNEKPDSVVAERYDPTLEAFYQDTCSLFRDPPASKTNGLVLLGTMVLFAVTFAFRSPLSGVIILTCVALIHEMGHLLAMIYFEYRDTRIFFLPFFGAATTGKRTSIENWKEGVVLLMGPTPGILLGLLILGFFAIDTELASFGPLREFAFMLIAINCLNLLPLGILDGGKFFQTVLFSRNRYLETAFLVATVIVGISMAIGHTATKNSILLVLMFASIRGVRATLWSRRISDWVHRRLPVAPTDLNEIPEPYMRALFEAVRSKAAEDESKITPNTTALAMRSVIFGLAGHPPSWVITVALIAAWSAALLLSWFGISTLSTFRGR